MDPTIIPTRPVIFVAVASKKQDFYRGSVGNTLVRPKRPYMDIEYWRDGNRLNTYDGQKIALQILEGK